MKKLWTMLTILCLTAYVVGCGSDTGTKGKASGKGKAANGKTAGGKTTQDKTANGEAANGQTSTPKPTTPGADNAKKPADTYSQPPETNQSETKGDGHDHPDVAVAKVGP